MYTTKNEVFIAYNYTMIPIFFGTKEASTFSYLQKELVVKIKENHIRKGDKLNMIC